MQHLSALVFLIIYYMDYLHIDLDVYCKLIIPVCILEAKRNLCQKKKNQIMPCQIVNEPLNKNEKKNSKCNKD